jgi:hypothetical protein
MVKNKKNKKENITIDDNQILLFNGTLITLNDEQYEGIKKIRAWLESTDKYFVLAGYAGTGKSTCVKKILDESSRNIIVSAPTHKARKVIESTTHHDGKTLHALLGLRPDLDLDDFNPNDPQFAPIASSTINDYGLIVIDEASMINQELFDMILTKTQAGTQILFMGDPAQIPPVGEKESVVFKDDNINCHWLTKIERQNDDNPLSFIYDSLRNNLEMKDDHYERITVLNNDGDGVIFTADKQYFRTSIIEKFKSLECRTSTEFVKVIAWTNAAVKNSNKIIRSNLFSDSAEIIEIGDVLMGYRTVSSEKVYTNIIENSADYRVLKKSNIKTNEYGILGYDTTIIEDFSRDRYSVKNVFIVNTYNFENKHKFAEIHDMLKNEAKQDKNLWKVYYKFRRENLILETIDKFRNGYNRSKFDVITKDLDYGYAITAHKCLSENTDILTINGNIKIKDIKINDLVCVGQGIYERVINKYDSGIKKSFELTTKSGYKIKCSEDHKILDSYNIFKPLKDFNIGEHIPINRNNIDNEMRHNKDLYYYLGLLVADGSYAGNRKRDKYRIDITIGNDDYENIEFIKQYYSDNNINYGITKKSNCVNIYCSNKCWRTKLFDLGLNYNKHSNKSTPLAILNGTYQMKANFISGLFDGDGHISKRGRIILVNVSIKLINEIQNMLLEFGIVSFIRKERQAFKLTIIGTSSNMFKKHISFRLKRKQDVLMLYNSSEKTNIDFIPNKNNIFDIVKKDLFKKNTFFIKNKGLNPQDFKRFPNYVKHLSYGNLNNIIKLYEYNGVEVNETILEIYKKHYFYDEIISIEEIGYEQMYDLEINNIHQYVANGFITHNCQGSTYAHVFVIEDDIENNSLVKERNQIKYVAITRPKYTATILSKKTK